MSRRIGLRHMQSVGGKKFPIDVRLPEGEHGGYYDNRGPFDPANTYDNIVGSIWMLEVGFYDDHYRIQLLSPEGPHGGYYDNRE